MINETFSISTKIQDGGGNSNNKFFRGMIFRVYTTQRVQTFLEMPLFLTVVTLRVNWQLFGSHLEFLSKTQKRIYLGNSAR